MKKVMVVMGGFSSERDVSLVTGNEVAKALKKSGYETIEYDLTNGHDFASALAIHKPDIVFNALHGNFGEDGSIQGFLDIMQIPYTHSNLETSAIGMDKSLTKKIAEKEGIKVAKEQIFEARDINKVFMHIPYVVKPVSDGSSVGVHIIMSEEDEKNLKYENPNQLLMMEKYIAGRELTVMVLNNKSYVVTELKPKEGFYDYKAKYTNGMTEHIIPAQIPDDIAETCKEYAVKIHKKLGCNTVSRSDFRYNEQDGVVFLEINTNPGLTPLSLVPEQAKYAGISYEELCKTLVENASCKKI